MLSARRPSIRYVRTSPIATSSDCRVVSVIVLFAAALVACAHETTLVAADPDDTTNGGGGTLQKAELVVTASLIGEDAAIAAMVGMAGGVLSGADVTIERVGSTGSLQTVSSDGAGRARFTHLLPGNYRLSVLRPLTEVERSMLDSANADVTTFGGGTTASVTAPTTASSVVAVAGKRGSLVISEIFAAYPPLAGGGWYSNGQYIELFNNSDTAIYLDGKIIARAMGGGRDSPNFPCDPVEYLRNDPDGIWSQLIYAVPGSGPDNVLRPRESVVIATDGIDHQQFVPELFDLTNAGFEFVGPSDVDNPAVPNMLVLGPTDFAPINQGDGLKFDGGSVVIFIAEPVDVSTLPRVDVAAFNVPEHRRIPRERILDVVSYSYTPEIEAASTFLAPLCAQLVHANFDRQHAAIFAAEAIESMIRRHFGSSTAGTLTLQRTRTSSRDFMRAPPSPGWVP